MSDTTAERRDHYEPWNRARTVPGGRGLVTGLGLGCIVGAMLDELAHVDVVERDERVARLIGGWYVEQFGADRVTIHHADAYTWPVPADARWDVAWHDIWPDLTIDNLPRMTELTRRFRARTAWQGCWGRELLRRERRRPQRLTYVGGWR